MPWHSPFRRRENADQLRSAGDIARDQRDWQTAASYYSRYLELKPEDAAIWVQLGHCRKETGDRDHAERAYLRALSIEPNNPDTHVQMGHIEKLNGRPDQALAWYRKAILIDPRFEAAIHEVTQLSGKAPSGSVNLNESDGDVDATIAAAIERRIKPLTDQIGAIKAVALELQRVRRSTESADTRISEVAEAIKTLENTLASLQSSQAARINELEAKIPAGSYSFPALLTQLSEVKAQKVELDQFREKIDALARRLNGSST